MTCDQVREHLPDYLVDEIDEGLRPEVEAHLETCAACRQDAAAWTRLGNLRDERPSPALRARFEAMLEAHRHDEMRRATGGWLGGWWQARPAFGLALAAACLLVGIAIGQTLGKHEASNGQLGQLREEVRNMREMVALSLLQQQSATDRLQGVNWSYRMDRPDSDVLTALLRTVKFDSSVDVRLAALDALKHFSRESTVRQGLVDALGPQKSPLVQIAMIDLLVEIREPRAADALRSMSRDASLDPAVRQRAAAAIGKLQNGGGL